MRLAWAIGFAVGIALGACGGSKDSVTPHGPSDLTPEQIDSDALALLPGSAVVLAVADARAFYQSGNVGSQIAQISEKLVPLGDEAGFSASRDVDKVTLAAYSMQGADVAAVVGGRFDTDKIDLAARNHTPTKSGGSIVSSQYAGRTLYTVSNVGFSVLTPHTALAGTEAGIRRALDRIQAGKASRDLPPWMIATVESKGAEVAVAVDLTNAAVQSATAAGMPLAWMQGLRMARILGDFHDPGMNVAGTLTYGDAQQAQSGAQLVKQAGGIANLLAVTGLVPQLRNLDVTVDGTNVECKFAVDDQAMRNLLAQVPQWIGSGASTSPSSTSR